MVEVCLQAPRIAALIGEDIAGRMSEHVRVRLDLAPAPCAALSIIRRKPETENGAPRWLTNTNVFSSLSR